MGLRSNGFYATVWEVKPGEGNYVDVKLSTSRKNPKDNTKYMTDYSGFARFVGNAKKMASGLKKLDRIHVTEFEVTNHYDKEKNLTFTNLAVFSAEMSGQSQNPAPNGYQDEVMSIPDDADERGLPFN